MIVQFGLGPSSHVDTQCGWVYIGLDVWRLEYRVACRLCVIGDPPPFKPPPIMIPPTHHSRPRPPERHTLPGQVRTRRAAV